MSGGNAYRTDYNHTRKCWVVVDKRYDTVAECATQAEADQKAAELNQQQRAGRRARP